MQEVSGSIPLFSTKSTVLRLKYGAFLFYSGKKIRGAPLAMQTGQCHPRSQTKPLSDLTHVVFSAPRRQLHAKARQRISTLTVFYGRGWITQAAHLKKPRRGFFPRRTVRRVDAVRIHPPSLREGYYKTETPVPGSDTGVLGGRGWIRTTEAEKQQIYSLSPLATREHAHISHR